MNTPKQCRECCCVDPVDGFQEKRIYYAENREERRDAANKARLKNIDKARESARAQYQANKEVYLTNARNRKARLKSAKGTHTKSEVLVLWASQNKRCAVPRCKFPIAAIGKDKYHVDHIVALINGGTNDISNLQILCRTHNCSKQAKKPEEWAKAIGLLFV